MKKDKPPRDPDASVFVATISSDPETVDAVNETLKANGIESGSEGSRVYAVSVARRDAEQARKVLDDSRTLIPGIIDIRYDDCACAPLVRGKPDLRSFKATFPLQRG